MVVENSSVSKGVLFAPAHVSVTPFLVGAGLARFSTLGVCLDLYELTGGARRRRRRRPPTASRLKGPRKQKSFAYKLLKRGLAKSFAYKLLKRGLANLMSPTSTSGVAPPLFTPMLSLSINAHNTSELGELIPRISTR
ncbi:hypothetical protein EVAR_17280_1 [Eumeta japonica]|uniref:Uncharacterized protein n=1 Tax=Eumeta variegata TaxID=151549 RepID=A0A4C1TT24_EUMVA|nr:hypothetical protein EVAR_17280_1 [Eumeta japonica]